MGEGRLKGVFPPIPTSFDGRGEVDPEALSENLRWWLDYGLSGFVVLGSNGEAVLLKTSEKLRWVESARDRIPERRLLIVGTGLPSTKGTILFTQRVAHLGADYALVLPPSYYRGLMTDEILERHFHEVADASPIPVILYNMPACTGLDLDAHLVVRIARHDNVVGLKDSGGDVAKIGRIYGDLGDRFRILAGSASFFLLALSVGAVGGILALANIAPAECLRIYQAATSGDLRKAKELQARMIPPNAAVTRRWGVPGLKAALDMLGQRGGPVRPPLRALGETARAELRSILVDAGILEMRKENESP